ncbi:MAG TPA: hypothetical protein VLH37_01985 [Bacteroidales bacterium]|nr:hypothetical protein [Bacteroidales bacterium]
MSDKRQLKNIWEKEGALSWAFIRIEQIARFAKFLSRSSNPATMPRGVSRKVGSIRQRPLDVL